MKIVIVDDSTDNINLMKLYTKKSSEEFVFFTSPQEAIDFLKRDKVDLVFLDIQMPVLDGFEVLSALRQDDFSKDLFICALTAFSSDTEMKRIKNAGFNDFVQKPILREQFLKYLDEFKLEEAS